MKCPFCASEMQTGALTGDGRCKVLWEPEENRPGFLDKMVGKGSVESAEYSLSRFRLKAEYCPHCKKIILDTGVSG